MRFGEHVIDGRSRVAHALDEFRDELLRDLGGPEAVSQQERVIVDLAVRTHLLVASIDNYLLSLGSLVNRRKRALWPVVRERVALADSLARYMGQLGLQRREKPIPSLQEYLASREALATEETSEVKSVDESANGQGLDGRRGVSVRSTDGNGADADSGDSDVEAVQEKPAQGAEVREREPGGEAGEPRAGEQAN